MKLEPQAFQNGTLEDLVPLLFSIQVSHDMILQEGVYLPALCEVNFLLLVLLPAARSPVFSHLSSSLHGLWTIRAFRAEQRFQNVFDAHQDLHSGAPPLFSDAMESLYYSTIFCDRCVLDTLEIKQKHHVTVLGHDRILK